jgi:cGMP-dependent protein kinase 1
MSESSDFERKDPFARRDSKVKIPRLSYAVDCADLEYTSNLVKRYKTARDVESISRALIKHFIFTNLSLESRVEAISKMELYLFEANKVIFKQNTFGKNFFIIAKGDVEVLVDNKQVAVLHRGDSFGELALVHDFPRSASVVALSRVYLWGLDRTSFKESVRKLNSETYNENKRFIDGFPLFNTLTPEQENSLLESISEFKFRAKQTIVNEGDFGDLCYFIKEGTVKCIKAGNFIGEINVGGYFGEQALLSDSKRTASIIATTDVKCLAISRSNIESALRTKLQHIIFENSKLISMEKNEFLKILDKPQKKKLAKSLKITSYKNNGLVIYAGENKSDTLYIVIHGKLVSQGNVIAEVFDSLFDADAFFNRKTGKSDLAQEARVYQYLYDVYASGDTHIATISKESFQECVGCINNMRLEDMKALKKVEMLRSLPSGNFAAIASCLKIEKYSDQQVIIQQNTPGELFFLIESGKVDIIQDGVVLRTITKHDYFGERSLLFQEVRTASVIANGDVTCWTLSRQDFMINIQGSCAKRLIKRIEFQDSYINLSDLKFLKVIGSGTLGTVFLTADKKKNRLYALKVISKFKMDFYSINDHITLEKQVLLTLDHEFILKLIKIFEDDRAIYLLTEYVKGEDLFDVIHTIKVLSEYDVCFYVSCLIVILEYLHEREIIYRDLKPENIRIDEEGYPKLIDFGSSRFLDDRSYTIIGTPHYMAPEMITGKGYSYSVDYWSLGIVLYELLFGFVPFGDKETDPFKVYEAILKRNLVIPNSELLNFYIIMLIEQLLNPSPAARSGESAEKIKNNQWFDDINWDSLVNKEVHPPYIPDLVELNQANQALFKTASDLETAFETEIWSQENLEIPE